MAQCNGYAGMANERGYPPVELERGDDRPGCRLPLRGCLALGVAVLLIVYGLYRFAIWIGFTASASA